MSTSTNVRIDASMSIEEMVLAARKASVDSSLPSAGGPLDTKKGWAKRLGIGRYTLESILGALDHEVVRGYVMRDSGPYPCELIRSEILEQKANEVGADASS